MRRLPVTLVAAVAAASVLLSTPAGAENLGTAEDVKYKRISTSITGDPESDPTGVELFTYCKKGWKAVGGGQTISAADDHGIGTTGKGGTRYWYIEAWQRSESDSTLTGYVVCLDEADVSTDTTSYFNFPGPGQYTEAAYCPGGYAVGGGMRAIGTNWDYSLNATYPIDDTNDSDTVPDDGWQTYIQYSGIEGGDALFDVVCVDGDQPAYRSTTVSAPAGEVTKVRAKCPNDRPVVGGGVYASGAASLSHVVASRPFDSGDGNDVWEDGWHGAISNTSGGALSLTTHAICR